MNNTQNNLYNYGINNNLCILLILSSFPSKEHPYISRLIIALKHNFPNLKLFILFQYNKNRDEKIFNKTFKKELLPIIIRRQNDLFNPLKHIKVITKILFNIKHSINILKDLKSKNLTYLKIYGQFFFYSNLLGKKFDLVHINAIQAAYHFKSFLWFKTAKIIVSIRGQDFEFYPHKYDMVLKNADHFHVLSNYQKNILKEKSIEESKITIIPPAATRNSIIDHPKKLNKNEIINIATAARLEWIKGYRYSIRTIKKLIETGLKINYHIYGEGSQKEELLYMVKQLNLTKYVFFHGWVNENKLIEEFAKIDLYILLSIAEAFNNSVLLAQSCGVPCIVTNVGGLPENVLNGYTGIVVEPYNPVSTANAIINLINNKVLYSNLSNNAFNRAKDLNFEKQVNEYCLMYKKLVENTSS